MASRNFVYEKSNRFSASWKFLRENNRRTLEEVTGFPWCVAKVVLFMNLPISYTLSLMRAEYSPQNLGYRF